MKPIDKWILVSAVVIGSFLPSGCGNQGQSGNSGIPVSELENRKSDLTYTEILKAVKASFPAEQYMSNDFLPAEGDFENYQNKTSKLREIRVGMPWIMSDGFSPIYIGIEKGFFESVGLKVDLFAGGPGRDHLQTLVGGQVDFAITSDGMNLPVFAASRTTGDIVGIGSFLKKNPVAYLSLDTEIPQSASSDDVVTPQDFLDSTIGVIRGGTHYVEFLVDYFGLDPDRVRVRWAGATPDALITGVVDHWATWILAQPRMLEKNGYRNWRSFFFHDLGWKQYCDIIVARRETLEDDPELARRFLAALAQAVDFYLEQPNEAAEITSRYSSDVKYTVEEVKRRFDIEREYVYGNDGLPLLHMSPELWNEVTALFVQYGLIEDTLFKN